tara:strand:- start:476 stop:1984 length:1509 start_codon:yes stop_codon:yes gene_type:complete
MDNTFFNENTNKESFKSYLKDIYSFKVGFYSVGLYPASLAYNCAMHSDKKNILLAPRPGRNLLGAFTEEVLTQMDPKIIDEILLMGSSIKNERKEINNLSDLILKCNLVILASNSNHIQEDISLAIKLKKDLNRENVVLACLVGSFCIDKYNQKPFILCEKYPNLAFFSGFHRHGALRNSKDSFSANFCHPDSFTALIGANILDQLSPKINVSAGVHNIECQYIKAIKNVSSIFAGFINKYHSDKPGMLPTINTVLLSQCFDQAATVSFLIRRKHKIKDQFLSLKELGYRYEIIKSQEIKNDQIFEKNDHTFSQLNAVIADVLGSMSLPIDGKPTRNFQAGQVLSEMIFQLKRCPKDIGEFILWCNKYELSQGGLEGLKSLKFWPYIYKQYFIENNNSSMINLIYLCFYGNFSEKELIYEVLIDPEELINYSQESVKSSNSLEITNKLSGRDIFNDLDNLYEKIFFKNIDLNKDNSESIKNDTSKEKKYIKVMKLINKYFSN